MTARLTVGATVGFMGPRRVVSVQARPAGSLEVRLEGDVLLRGPHAHVLETLHGSRGVA